ncbi:hypothetical protein KCU81_g439, partial [Aureobasidium melanogenum]
LAFSLLSTGLCGLRFFCEGGFSSTLGFRLHDRRPTANLLVAELAKVVVGTLRFVHDADAATVLPDGSVMVGKSSRVISSSPSASGSASLSWLC